MRLSSLTVIGRFDSACGQSGTRAMPGTAGWRIGPLAESARGIAASSALARTGWFEPRRLGSIAEDHIAGRADHGRLLWQLLMLDRSLSGLSI